MIWRAYKCGELARARARYLSLSQGKLAGEDQEATDQANLDEVAGLLKQRGVFGTPSVEDTIKEMEDEYHDNIRFGLRCTCASSCPTCAHARGWTGV